MTQPQIYTLVALAVYAIIMALIGCLSFGKSKTLDGFLIGGRNIGAWATAFAYGTTYFSAVAQSRHSQVNALQASIYIRRMTHWPHTKRRKSGLVFLSHQRVSNISKSK